MRKELLELLEKCKNVLRCTSDDNGGYYQGVRKAYITFIKDLQILLNNLDK
jgi:hypothetical protein